METVERETAPAFATLDDAVSVNRNYIKKDCPRLSAAFDEAIRLTSFSASVRSVERDTVIGGKTLRKGGQILIPFRFLHLQSQVFGEDRRQFNSTRFLKDEKLRQSPSFRPFGGGVSLCPGRHVAKHAIMFFVAVLLRRYEIRPVVDQAAPEPELQKPVLGIMDKRATDGAYLVDICPRDVPM